jgi:transposase
MIKIEFSEKDIKILKYERYHNKNPNVQKKMEVLYLKSKGLKHQEICKLCDITRMTLSKYLKVYVEKGIEGLKETNYKGQPSELLKYTTEIKEYFKKHPPSSTAEAQAKIEEITGIKRSPTQIRLFLNKMGMRCRKLGFVPGKGVTPEKIEEQEVFKEEKLMPRLEEAKEGKRAVFF